MTPSPGIDPGPHWWEADALTLRQHYSPGYNNNIALKEIEKKSKYKDLELEIQRMWYMETIVIPVVVGALGTVKKGMVENIKKVSERATVTEIQKICMLGSARILRKVLSI